MITLQGWRAPAVRRCIGLWMVVSVCVTPLGCAEKTSDIDAQAPIAVTEGGVEIVRVERDVAARMIVADVRSGGSDYEVSLESARVAPFPAGITARVGGGGTEFVVSVAWDPADERVWMRQRTATDEFEVTRWIQDGVVHERARLNGVETGADYPVAWTGQLDRALTHWRGNRTDPAMDVAMSGAFDRFDAMRASYNTTTLVENPGGDLLAVLLNDAQFAKVIAAPGDEPLRAQETIAGTLCSYLSLCAGIACKFFPQACTFCASGVIACAIVDLACRFMGCECCF